MAERKKLELEVNKPAVLELLFDEPVVGQSKYGDYFLYTVKNGTGEEYSYFATEDVHQVISKLKKGDKVEVTKIAEKQGTKVVTYHNVKIISKPSAEPHTNGKDNYYDMMLMSCRDAIKIQNELGGMFDAKSLAVTLFIARSKINGDIR